MHFKDILDHGFIVFKQNLFYNGSKIWWKRTERKVARVEAVAHDYLSPALLNVDRPHDLFLKNVIQQEWCISHVI